CTAYHGPSSRSLDCSINFVEASEALPLASRTYLAPGFLICRKMPSSMRTYTPEFDPGSFGLKTTRIWQLPNFSFLYKRSPKPSGAGSVRNAPSSTTQPPSPICPQDGAGLPLAI